MADSTAAGLGAPPERRIRVLVADDFEVALLGFRALFAELPWVADCLATSDPAECLRLAAAEEPHVALVGLSVGDQRGVELSAALRRASPSTRVLLVADRGWISPQAAKAAAASGLVARDWTAEEIATSVLAVVNGRTAFPPPPEQPGGALSPREREVLALLATGATNREIADRLLLSPHTVKEHASALYRKLGVRNRAEAVQRAERLGLVA